jgi:FSR family fosmidomycin resistance protein-like MFS transporter
MESTENDAIYAPPVAEISVPEPSSGAPQGTVLAILFAISFSHLLNDTMQMLIPALYPLFRQNLGLNYAQIGLITFTFQCTASLLQPLVGLYTDKRPMPYSLPAGMGITFIGLIVLAFAHDFGIIILAAALVGMGSAIFHPEASRVAYLAAGRKRGFAQSLFQVGGNTGSSLGPLLAALIITRYGQAHVAWFALLACIGMFVLFRVGQWQSQQLLKIVRQGKKAVVETLSPVPRKTVIWSLAVLMVLVFSKYVYLVSLTSYYTFYLIERFGVTAERSQLLLFVFLAAVAAGTIIGGPIGDRIGRKRVIWASILGVTPFTLWLPHAGLVVTVILSAVIGFILASAFSAILVYAQELLPGKVGLVAGLFFGLAFGIAGIGAAALGKIADNAGIIAVFHGCAYLPLLGILTVFLPNIEGQKKAG